MAEAVCAFCFKSGTIIESVTLYGCWQGISVTIDPAQPGRFKTTTTGERGVSWSSTDGEGFYCSHCHQTRSRIEEMVTSRPFFECRSCGFRGAEAKDHPDSCGEEPERIDPPEISPGQERLTA